MLLGQGWWVGCGSGSTEEEDEGILGKEDEDRKVGVQKELTYKWAFRSKVQLKLGPVHTERERERVVRSRKLRFDNQIEEQKRQMDLEVVGRHTMLFDDDGMAAFVNSAEALVEWNALSIDRYDVRHLLSAPLPPRLKRRPPPPESDLDHQRYLDLPFHQQPQDNGADPVSSDGFHAVGFSYGNSNISTETKDNDTESSFRPNFPVPESLLHNLFQMLGA
ncbi:hypothetical protein VNO78_31990 [Psophocarpus tetragonolobus]|uniref:Suppressor of white apricot N-terminal domain-containing protein n=1 Tax=Psophocarpus tetragonolobus TaxID=3891 RepID=A0AAN9RZQ7_PSOTE